MHPAALPPGCALWLEFEEYGDGYPRPGDDPECDFCNAHIRMNGQVCSLNIWTFGFVDHVRRFDEATGLPKPEIERFLLPPDLLVERLERELIEQAIAFQLTRHGGSPEQWRWRDEEDIE